MGVPKRKDGIEREVNRALGDKNYLEVPQMVGLSMREVATTYDQLPLVVEGKGSHVIQQSPAAGVKIEEGSKIRIYLGDKSSD